MEVSGRSKWGNEQYNYQKLKHYDVDLMGGKKSENSDWTKIAHECGHVESCQDQIAGY